MLISATVKEYNSSLLSTVTVEIAADSATLAESMAADQLRAEGYTVCRVRACQDRL
jgi:hypothetical protein